MSAADFYGLSYLPFVGDTETVSNRFDSIDLLQAIAVTNVAAREIGTGILTGTAGIGISYSCI